MKPLIYLEIRQFVNAIKNITRSPKRLIPVLFMVLWVLMSLSGTMLSGMGHQHGPSLQLLRNLPIDAIEKGVFLFISIGSILVMYNSFGSGMMVFSIAHIDFLFPTPISRRSVLLVKLIKDYLKYGFYVAFFFIFMGFPAFGSLGVSAMPWGFVSIAAVTALMLLVVNLSHTINIVFTFAFERLKLAGTIIKVVLIAIPVSALAFGLYQFARTGDTYTSILLAANSPVIKFAFTPARWCATLFLAPLIDVTTEGWFELAALYIMVAFSFALLLSRKENIYEPSLGVSVKFAERRTAMRSGDYAGMRVSVLREKGATRASGISIPPFGRGATAILWKSILLRYRMSPLQTIAGIVVPTLIVYVIKTTTHSVDNTSRGASIVLGFLPLVLFYVVWIISLMAQQEMRAELKHANVLKSMPIASWKVMAVQALHSTLYLGMGILVFTGVLWVILAEVRAADPHRGLLLPACALGSLFVGFVNVGVSLISALLYPDIRDPVQAFLGYAVCFVISGLAIIPCLVVAGLLLYFLKATFIQTAAAMSLVNLVMGSAGVAIAGMLFRKFDPTGE